MVNKLVAAAATDTAAENEGTWFEYSPGGDQTFRVKLARAGTSNPAYMKLQNDLLKPWRAGARNPNNLNIPHDKDREIQRKLHAQTIVKDWHTDDVGEPFSVPLCMRMFQEANDFLDWVIMTCNAADNFRRQQVEEHAGN